MSDVIDVQLKNRIVSAFCASRNDDYNKVFINEVKGGFTGAFKFVLDVDGEKLFLKVADNKTQKTDVFLIHAEAEIYSLLKQWELCGDLFPLYKGLINKKGLNILVLDYLNLNWGGPWNMKNIKLLDKALKRLHKTSLTEEEKKGVTDIAVSVKKHLGQIPKKDISDEEKNKPFVEAWNLKRKGFESSDGNIYFKGKEILLQKIIEESENKTENPPQKLIMHDMNFANIGFSETQAYFVDPVFARIGDPLHDRTVVGINILQRIGRNITLKTRRLVVDNFLRSKPILAGMIKYHTTTAKESKETSDSDWQKYHQSCAIAALDTFTTI